MSRTKTTEPAKPLPPPSPFQAAIKTAFKGTKDNLLVQACAGSGKTTLLQQLCEETGMLDMVVALCFNKVIADEFKKRLPFHVKACTMHSLGYEICRGNARIKMDTFKRDNILDGIIKARGYKGEERIAVTQDATWLMQMAYATMTDLDDASATNFMITAFGGELSLPAISIPVASATMKMCRAQRETIGYDDMIDHPLYHKYKPQQFKIVFVDEAQDLNLQQIAFIKYISAPGARIVAVGDRFQAIYQWRGADTKAMDRIKTEFDCVEMPLSISYRCPKAVVDLARQITDTIEASPSAIDGEIDIRRGEQYDELLPTIEPGTMVVCRTNAPLMPMCMGLIRLGKKAIIRGKDIGKGLDTLITKMEERIRKAQPNLLSIPKDTFMKVLRDDTKKRVRKAVDQDKMKAATYAIDQFETIAAAFHEVSSVPELRDVIKRIFTDDTASITLSSVHRAKGLEAPDVVILAPELMPHPMAFYAANQEEALQQENNLLYVAITRAKRKLIYQPLKSKSIGSTAESIMAFMNDDQPYVPKVVTETAAVFDTVAPVLDAAKQHLDTKHAELLASQDFEPITGKPMEDTTP